MGKFHVELSTGRIIALTDGVFAIAMTILVLNFDFHLPKGIDQITVMDKFSAQWPEFLHYIESFFILACFWIKNHQQFHFIRKTNQTFLWINIAGLMLICLIPYSTSVVIDYGELAVATLFFDANMLAVGLIYYLTWSYATKGHRLVDPDVGHDVISFYKISSLTIPILSVIAIALSLWHPRWGTTVYLLVPAIPMIHSRRHSA